MTARAVWSRVDHSKTTEQEPPTLNISKRFPCERLEKMPLTCVMQNRALEAGSAGLDNVDLTRVFPDRAKVMRAKPSVMKGGFKSSKRVVLKETYASSSTSRTTGPQETPPGESSVLLSR